MLGSFQAQNAALAVAAVDVLSHTQGFSMDAARANRALADIQFPGRMEVIQENPQVILDGAHNPQKALALSKSMAELYPHSSFTLICGMLRSKDAAQSVKHLLPRARRVVAVTPHAVGRASLDAAELAGIIRNIGYAGRVDVYPDVIQALDVVLESAGPGETILVTGSLYMVGEARGYWVKPETLLIEAELTRDALSP
jgi:dihydrofolate synthase/folylpolyglutamate synthase